MSFVLKEDATATALRNEVVLRKIFTALPMSDLKQCGLVSKKWKFEVGSFMRDFRVCNATIPETCPCYGLQALNNVVSRMDIVYFTSLTINFGRTSHNSNCKSNNDNADDEKDFHALYGDLVGEKLPLKHLNLTWRSMPQTCPVLFLVIALFQEKFQDLQSFKIDYFPPIFSDFFGEWWTPSLPKLKELNVVSLELRDEPERDLFLRILNGAPNLEKLSGEIDTSKLDLLPEIKYSLLTNIYLRTRTRQEGVTTSCLPLCKKLVKSRPKLSKLVSNAPGSQEIEFITDYFLILEQLLMSSARTLEELVMLPSIFPLCHFPVVLMKLKKLRMFAGMSEAPQVLTVLRSINYSRYFPTLEHVELVAEGQSEGSPQRFVNPWEGRQIEAQPEPVKLKILNLSCWNWTLITLEDLNTIFSHVSDRLIITRFSFAYTNTIPIPYEELWAYWPEVQAVELIEDLRGNYDAEFLGIYPEEVQILRGMDEEFLEQLNLVPIQPSVLTRSGLKSLEIRFKAKEDPTEENYIPEQLFLSKVTGILALKKFKKMGIHFGIYSSKQCDLHLNHLRPFAKIVVEP